MNKIKTYRNFINEGIRDKMTPKSNEEIREELEKLDPERKLSSIFRYNFEDNFTKSQLKEMFFNVSPEGRMYFYTNPSYRNRIDFVSEDDIKETLNQIEDVKEVLNFIYQNNLNYFTDEEIFKLLDKVDEKKRLDLILTHKINYPKEETEKLITKAKGKTEVFNFDEIIGRTISDINLEYYDSKSKNYTQDKITFTFNDGDIYEMFHNQDCCESVHIDDIDGELDDLIGEPIRIAEEVSSKNTMASESGTWTFYRFATINGYVTIRWYGFSNGYYSERVSFEKRN